eukprot:776508-Karenia_brevis.AAC.1
MKTGSNDGIMIKADQEPALKFLVDGVHEERKQGRTVIEHAPKGVKGSNGFIERAVLEIEQRARAIYLFLESRIGVHINPEERIIALLPSYAAYLYSRLHKGGDGKVPYDRAWGQKPAIPGADFGEEVWYKRKLGSKMETLEARWKPGLFVGVDRKSNEVIVSTEEGIRKSRSNNWIPMDLRWSIGSVKWIKLAPWRKHKDAENADGDLPEGAPDEEREQPDQNQDKGGGGQNSY